MSTKQKFCDYCRSEEGKPRPIGQYNVVLQEVIINGKIISACQSCAVNNRDVFSSKSVAISHEKKSSLNPSLLQKLKEKLSRS